MYDLIVAIGICDSRVTDKNYNYQVAHVICNFLVENVIYDLIKYAKFLNNFLFRLIYQTFFFNVQVQKKKLINRYLYAFTFTFTFTFSFTIANKASRT